MLKIGKSKIKENVNIAIEPANIVIESAPAIPLAAAPPVIIPVDNDNNWYSIISLYMLFEEHIHKYNIITIMMDG